MITLRLPVLVMACGAMATSLAHAQRTWTVRPWGADFTEIQPAFDAALPGDTIIVQSRGGYLGTYAPATTSKGVKLLSTAAWGGMTGIEIVDLPADQTFVMAGFQGAFPVVATRCAGAVHLDQLRHSAPLEFCGPGTIHFRDCRFATFNFGSIWNVVVENSTVLIHSAHVYGLSTPCPYDVPPSSPPWITTGYAGIRMTNSDVTLVDCQVIGARAYPTGPHAPIPGIWMQGGTLRLSGTSTAAVGSGELFVAAPPPFFYSVVLGPAIESYGGTIVLDPDVRLVGMAPLIQGNSRVITEDSPYMRIWHLYPPTVWGIPLELHAPPGTSALLCVSVPAPPLPTPFGDLWLDLRPGGIYVAALATVPPTGLLEVTSPLNAPWAPGVAPMWQAVLVDPVYGIRLSMPAVPVLGVY